MYFTEATLLFIKGALICHYFDLLVDASSVKKLRNLNEQLYQRRISGAKDGCNFSLC